MDVSNMAFEQQLPSGGNRDAGSSGLEVIDSQLVVSRDCTNSLRATAMFNGTLSTSTVKAWGLMLDVNDVCISILFTRFLDYNSIAASPESLQLCCCGYCHCYIGTYFPVVGLVCDELLTTFVRLDRYKLFLFLWLWIFAPVFECC
ncbi:unnamed protein product [Sphagnum troendelagicum]|uniref:Uncharacterized protein n=1 Tax=Sphagnum troendelagicum TaxID=128251 RepID=A0ABP0V300_9BRYO